MRQFYSSLIINSNKFSGVHQVFKPRYNREFFKRITANINQLEAHIDRRCEPDPLLDGKHLQELTESAKRLVKLKDKLDKINQDDKSYEGVLSQLEAIQDQIMPTVTRLPNRYCKLVPPKDVTLEEVSSEFMAKQKLAKILSHRKLSYINNCYVKSIVGPNSHYYFGIGAKLQEALSNYFASNLERENFIPVTGLCLAKSALVEASNSRDEKQYDKDPARILTGDTRFVTLHLTESSREALVGILTTLGTLTSNNPTRFMSSGASYKIGTDWFDGNDKHITQFETLNTLSFNSSIEQYSYREYLANRDLLWSYYTKLDIPCRLVHCSLDSMRSNEYDSHRIDVWLPSRQEWLQVSRISHYLDYITVRVGMKRGHLIDSSVYDGQVLVAAIIENRQTAKGKFLIPEVLKDHSVHLTQKDKADYFDTQAGAGVLHNYDQRRYLTKRNYVFGHSRKSHEITRRQSLYRNERTLIGLLIFFYLIIDWKEFWYDYVPERLRACMYNYIYRPWRRFWWYLVYEDGKAPADVPYEELDRKEFNRTMWDRKKEEILRDRGRGAAIVIESDDGKE